MNLEKQLIKNGEIVNDVCVHG